MLPKDPITVVVIGSGGREHAICWKLAQESRVAKIYCAPGNGGTAGTAKTENVDVDISDFRTLSKLAIDVKADLVVVGPDNPLAEGIVDVLEQEGLRVFGPTRNAACLEWSKVFAKEFMQAHQIPTARFVVCDSFESAEMVVRDNSWARVIKVDGLALGKGVFVCDSIEESLDALKEIFQAKRFGESGSRVVIEEKLSGPELSLLCLCDGKDLIPLLPSQDHKRRFDKDAGPNTGGMGAYAPADVYTARQHEIEKEVLAPVREALRNADFVYKGVLFIGLMLADKPYVLEFNCRFGDPETQAVLPLMTSDLSEALWACTEGKLADSKITWSGKSCCTVVAVAEAYPQGSSRGELIEIGKMPEDVTVFHSGTKLVGNKLVTNGGRIICVSAVGATLSRAVESAYSGIEQIKFAQMAYRKDIAGRALASC